jgi:hypothetical protein
LPEERFSHRIEDKNVLSPSLYSRPPRRRAERYTVDLVFCTFATKTSMYGM